MASSIFRQLTSGITFDKKKYREESEKFGLCSKKVEVSPADEKETIDLDDLIVPDSNMPTPEDSDEGENEADSRENSLTLLGEMRSVEKDAKRKKKKKSKSKESLAQIYREKVNHFRNIHRIHVKGSDIPDPIDKWDKLKENYGLPENVLQVLKDAYPRPTPVQMQAIPLMLDRREVLVCAPTGSGKTVSYLVPVVQHLREPRNKKGFRAVIVAPTRELAGQIHRECVRLCQPRQLRPFLMDKAAKAKDKVSGSKLDILVTTPNRLVYLIKNESVCLKSVEWLVVDESDRLFESGPKGFRDQLAVIYQACNGTKVRRAMFSATMAADVEEWCTLNLDNVATLTIESRNVANRDIEQSLVYTGTEKGKLIAFRQMVQLKPPVLVFVQEKARAKELFAELVKDNINVDAIHSDRSQLQRDNSVNAFRAGRIWVLICTELMGRGIDFKGVNLVVNYDFPPSTVSYIHRIGRTGRAGRPGKAVTFFTDSDKVLLPSIANIVRASGGSVPDYVMSLKKATRQQKRKLASTAVERASIANESAYDKEKRERLAKMIAKSKKRKLNKQDNKTE